VSRTRDCGAWTWCFQRRTRGSELPCCCTRRMGDFGCAICCHYPRHTYDLLLIDTPGRTQCPAFIIFSRGWPLTWHVSAVPPRYLAAQRNSDVAPCNMRDIAPYHRLASSKPLSSLAATASCNRVHPDFLATRAAQYSRPLRDRMLPIPSSHRRTRYQHPRHRSLLRAHIDQGLAGALSRRTPTAHGRRRPLSTSICAHSPATVS